MERTCGEFKPLTVSIAADCQLVILGHLHLDHCGFLVDNVLDSKNDLVNVFARELLPILESLNHVVDEFLSHLVSKLRAVVAGFDSHLIEIETLSGRGCFRDLDGLEKSISLDELLTSIELNLGDLVVWILLDDYLPVVDGIAVFEYGGVSDRSSVVCLDKGGVDIYGVRRICYCKSVCFELNVRLQMARSAREP